MGITGLVDLHNHLLPGVDDGARTDDETEKYLVGWATSGVSALVFTPHLLVPKLATALDIERRLDALEAVFERVSQRMAGRADVPDLGLGQEILAREGADLARVASNRRAGLGGSDAMLVELGFSPTWDADGVMNAAAAAGRRVLFAHPERYTYPSGTDAIGVIRRWRDAGALVQVNGASLLGRHTAEARRIGMELVSGDVATIVASDHHGDHRPDEPRTIHALVAGLVGEQRANRLMRTNPARIRAGLAVESGDALGRTA